MDGTEFLGVADRLLLEAQEAALRSAVSRAYYGAFNYSRHILRKLGFVSVARSPDHGTKWRYFANCGDPALATAGGKLQNLEGERVRADYHLDNKKFANHKNALIQVMVAKSIVEDLKRCETDGILAAAVAQGMKTYEEKLAVKK
jgi:hypothetical protein